MLLAIVFIFALLVLIFVFLFVKQIYDCVKFAFIKKEIKTFEKTEEKKKNFCIIKKSLILQRKRTYKNYCSFQISAKFLYEKEYKKLPLTKISLINSIYKKISNNTFLFNGLIDFSRLKNAGYTKPVFLLHVPKLHAQLNNLMFAIEEIKKRVEFFPIFVANEKINFEFPYKTISIQDINLHLFQEICKINLNYSTSLNEKFTLSNEDFVSKNKIDVKRIVDENKNLSYVFSSEHNTKVCVFIRTENEFFNINTLKNYFEIVYSNNKIIKYYSSNKINKIKKIKYNFNTYLLIEIGVNKYVKTTLLCGEGCEYLKNKILAEKIFFEKYFKLKIYTKNKKFNDFFNIILCEKIKDELYEKNFLNREEKQSFDICFLSKFFDVPYKEIVLNAKSPKMFRKFILENVFGIYIDNDKLFIKKKVSFSYKIIVNVNGKIKSVYVVNEKESYLKVGETIFSNTSCVDLSVLNSSAKLCV